MLALLLPLVYLFFTSVPFVKKFVIHADILPPLLDLLHLQVDCYWSWRRSLWNSNICPRLPRIVLHGVLPSRSLRRHSLLFWSPGLWPCFLPWFFLSGSWTTPSHGCCSPAFTLPTSSSLFVSISRHPLHRLLNHLNLWYNKHVFMF